MLEFTYDRRGVPVEPTVFILDPIALLMNPMVAGSDILLGPANREDVDPGAIAIILV